MYAGRFTIINLLDKLEFDEQLSYAPNLAMFSDRAYIDNNKERR